MQYPLRFRNGHFFIETKQGIWLLDTGAPQSFGNKDNLLLAGEQFNLPESHMGFTVEKLSGYISEECNGLLGADILGQFDIIMDGPGEQIELSTEELECNGHPITIDAFMGIPLVPVTVNQVEYKAFFDTGAQVSYLSSELLAGFPPAGEITDFYPGFGEFSTVTHHIALALGTVDLTLRCGLLPQALQGLLEMAGDVTGIIGNEILGERRIGYFPRRGVMVV